MSTARSREPRRPRRAHPDAPGYARELAAREGWWRRIWAAARARGAEVTTMTPEFGPDGYLHRLLFTDAPVADLASINRWMSARQHQRFTEAA